MSVCHADLIEKGISQQQLADMIHVDRSSIANWEIGRRMPDASMIFKLSDCLDSDVVDLLHASEQSDERAKVILIDDEKIIVDGEVRILKKAMPGAEIYGFTVPGEALDFSRQNKLQIAFLDIEMGRINGLNICRELLTIFFCFFY